MKGTADGSCAVLECRIGASLTSWRIREYLVVRSTLSQPRPIAIVLSLLEVTSVTFSFCDSLARAARSCSFGSPRVAENGGKPAATGRPDRPIILSVNAMRATRPKSPPHETAPAARGPTLIFQTGEMIKESGIYRVHHNQHRLPREVTLLQGQKFPRCARCDDGVRFELVVAAPADFVPDREHPRIYLYELPVLDEGITAP